MRIHYISATALLAAGAVVPATAQDFSGPFVGVQAGWQQTDVHDPETDLGPLPLDEDRQSLTGGVFAGYDYRVADRVVVGVEAGADVAANDASESDGPAALNSIDPKWSLDLTARAGYLVSPSTLAYVRGGYSNARLETSGTAAFGPVSETENRDGWTVGAGIERQLQQRISGRLEYRYSDFSQGDGTFDRHRILAGLAYRF